jgi:hypothetical protein
MAARRETRPAGRRCHWRDPFGSLPCQCHLQLTTGTLPIPTARTSQAPRSVRSLLVYEGDEPLLATVTLGQWADTLNSQLRTR